MKNTFYTIIERDLSSNLSGSDQCNLTLELPLELKIVRHFFIHFYQLHCTYRYTNQCSQLILGSVSQWNHGSEISDVLNLRFQFAQIYVSACGSQKPKLAGA